MRPVSARAAGAARTRTDARNPQQQQKADPITGIASESYIGKGQVQSAPKGN